MKNYICDEVILKLILNNFLSLVLEELILKIILGYMIDKMSFTWKEEGLGQAKDEMEGEILK